MIDLRSDTVTRPTAAMRRAMAEADVGDDVYGEDPTVNRLQELVAQMLGFEAALWVPTGAMGNAIGLRVLTRPGQEVLTDARSHVVQYELASMAILSGLLPRTVSAPSGLLTADIIQDALRPASYLRSDLGAVVLENTHNLAGGTIADVPTMAAAIAAAHEAGAPVHVDGARLWHAAVALGVAPRALVAGADTVMVTLSKGLCAPAGSLLAASAARIQEARRVRKQLGGGMRQVGVLAAAGLLAVDTMIDRLAEDHAHAGILQDALAGLPGVSTLPGPTNIVVAHLAPGRPQQIVDRLAQEGVLCSAMDARTLRLVTHHDVDESACRQAAVALRAALL